MYDLHMCVQKNRNFILWILVLMFASTTTNIKSQFYVCNSGTRIVFMENVALKQVTNYKHAMLGEHK